MATPLRTWSYCSQKGNKVGKIDFSTDSEISKDTFNNDRNRVWLANNSGLWVELPNSTSTKQLDFCVWWMPSPIGKEVW